MFPGARTHRLPGSRAIMEKGCDSVSVFLKVLRIVCIVFMIISCIVTVVLALFTTYNVVMRYLFGKPNSGVAEWSQMLLILSMTCLGYTFLDGRAIRVGVLVDRFPRNINLTFELVAGLLSFLFFILVGWRLFARIDMAMKFKEAYFVIKVAKWPMYAGLGASFFSAAVGTVSFVITRILEILHPKEKDNLLDNPEFAILALSDDGDETAGRKDHDSLPALENNSAKEGS